MYAKQVPPPEDIYGDEALELPIQPPLKENVTSVQELDHMIAQLSI